jgi:purine nucleosidase
VREVVLMGGAARPPGNVTPVAEFNIYADPVAAAIVFSQPWPLTMVGLDVTNRVLFTRHDRATLEHLTSPEAVLLREVTRHHFERLGVDAVALHDPLAVAVALDRSLVTTFDSAVLVETRGEHTLGQTVVDLRGRPDRAPSRTRVCEAVDAARARALFFSALGVAVPPLPG